MSPEPPHDLPDAAARRRAATDFATNLVVMAGAGTGKTSLLVERALNAIGSGVATMESIAAITFTEKAAGEMRERLAAGLDRLRRLAREPGPIDARHEADRALRHLREERGLAGDDIARRALEAMERLDRGTVVTIHRFCAELLRAWPREAGVDPSFVVDSGPWFRSLSSQAWEAHVRRELGPGGRPAESWGPLLRLRFAAIAGAAQRLAAFDVPEELLAAEPAAAGGTLLQRESQRAFDEVERWLARRVDLTELAEECFTFLRDALAALLREGPAGGRAHLERHPPMLERVVKGQLGSARRAAGAVAQAEVKRLANEVRTLLRAALRTDDASVAGLLDVARPFVAAFRESYLGRGLVDFTGLLVLTRNLLRDSPEVRRALKRRWRLLLVDEFQDTDPLQYEIVLFLAECAEETASDPFQARLAPGRLFVVGDAKQSVYRFRGADFAAYDRAVDRITAQGGVRLDLVGNFRSVPGIVEAVNLLFEADGGPWTPSRYQQAYQPIRAVRPPTADAPAVEIWTAELPEGALAEERREAEGRVIAEAIERWVTAERRYAYGQITILFRAFTRVTHYLRPLRERGIPFVVDGGREFLRRPEIAQLLATLRALARPANQPALLAYLRSPAGAVSDIELARWAGAGGRWSWRDDVDAREFPGVARAFGALRRIHDEASGLAVDALVRRVLDRTLALPLGAAAFEGAQRVANLQKLAAAAGELGRDGTLSLDEVIEALEEGRLEDIQTDRPLADDAADAVRMTSIHRMKGLENDVVILPDLARGRKVGWPDEEPVRVATGPEGQPLLAVRVGDLQNTARTWHDFEDARHEEAEEVRVLYVGLTRARERLVTVAATGAQSTPWLAALAPWGYDRAAPPDDGARLAGGRVLHRRLHAAARRRPADSDLPAEAGRACLAWTAARRALEAAARPPLAAPSRLAENREVRGTGGGARPGRGTGKAAGIVLHRLLGRWDGASPEALRQALAPACTLAARETRTDRAALERVAREILDAFLAGPLVERFARAERIASELPFLARDEETGSAWRGSVDLLYRDTHGGLVVVDFKTDRTTDRDALRARYGPQLAAYAGAVRRALELPDPPRTELWLLRSGEVVVLDDGSSPGPRTDRQGPGQLSLW
jgi:ATP-dependent helicase/nuclease subunit A